ncbi:plant UBX domain-containing protein 5-like [Hibiscus syriacus]|uniref:plant UBX domain-containing protein 5-like n=1 Tax=Hibiscus syriacus TaxID=106335 RepID=UPI001921F9B1|nr:plant UBX domain-containing protein 5-like [Hibiscus syriacus]
MAAYASAMKTESQCPKEFQPANPRTKVELHFLRRDENYFEPNKPQSVFHGIGRTLGSNNSSSTPSKPTVAASSITNALPPSMGLIVDSTFPTTSIQIRFSEVTLMVSRFNYHHTIRDVCGFVDAQRPWFLPQSLS